MKSKVEAVALTFLFMKLESFMNRFDPLEPVTRVTLVIPKCHPVTSVRVVRPDVLVSKPIDNITPDVLDRFTPPRG